jgi:hypothetical protein
MICKHSPLLRYDICVKSFGPNIGAIDDDAVDFIVPTTPPPNPPPRTAKIFDDARSGTLSEGFLVSFSIK